MKVFMMTGVGESAGTAAKVLEVLKDVPLWLLSGLSVSAGVLLWIPALAVSVPTTAHPWIIIGGVIFAVLATARSVGLLIERIPGWKASVDARRRFHLIAVSQQSFWASAKQPDDSIVTQVVVRLLVKNRTAKPLTLVRARLVSPKVRGDIVHNDISVRAVDRNVYGSAIHSGHVVPPDMSLPASVGLLIRGVPRRKIGQQVRATIGVTDDEGFEQKVVIDMRVVSPSAPEKISTSPLEMVSSISNPIEREVATVLQAELWRYDKCGRTVGGLGSVHLVIEGREMTGVGTDSWIPNSAKNQSISVNPDVSELRSDNLQALMAFYGRLATAPERDQFASALLSRMDGKVYLRVTYFIVCVLWKIGRLREGLERAKAKLPQGEMVAFGLSNTLMLFNGLLRYRHVDFTNDMLDDIEKFLLGLNEHPFQVPEKIAAIRTGRLMENRKQISSEGTMT